MKEIKIKDTMYRQDVRIIIGGTEKELCEYIYKKYHMELIADNSQGCHFPISKDGMYIHFIWMEDFNWTVHNQSVLSHEILHLVFDVFDKMGIEYKKEVSDEAFAYYFGRILEDVLKKLIYLHPNSKKIKK